MADKMERKKLIEYLPPFMQQFKEIKQITQVEDNEMDSIDSNIQKVFNNAFISECDEYGIKKYESLLSITPNADDTLESRKSRVLLRWNDALPYTYRTLVKKLDTFCGSGNYEIGGDLKNYTLIIKTHLSMPGQVEELEKMVERIVPANIFVVLRNQIYYDLEGNVFVANATIQTNHFTISSE